MIGVDGCRGGWLALHLGPGPGVTRAEIAASWRQLPVAQTAMVAVDMPIGLTEAGARGCDLAARRLLPKGRKSSVFPAPRRYMLACGSWAEAQAEGRRREGCGLSKQAWNILPKIREIDAAIRPQDQALIREAHPELIFHNLNGWAPLPSKRSREGRRARLALLEAAGLAAVATLLDRFPRAAAQPDDVVDAAACALAARRLLRGEALRLPEPPLHDPRGLRMEIWY